MRSGRLSRMPAASLLLSTCSDVSNNPSHSRWRSCRPLLCSLIGASRRLALRHLQLRHDFFLDVAQAVLAEKDFVADKEGRRTEGAACHRLAGVLDQLLLDVVQLRARNQAV